MPNFKLPTWNFRLFLPTLHLREQIENFRVLIGKRVSSYGAQTISIGLLVVTHRTVSFPPLCIIEPPRPTIHTLRPPSKRAQRIHPHLYDYQPRCRATQRPAYLCSSFILYSSPCLLETSEDLRLIVHNIVLVCYARVCIRSRGNVISLDVDQGAY